MAERLKYIWVTVTILDDLSSIPGTHTAEEPLTSCLLTSTHGSGSHPCSKHRRQVSTSLSSLPTGEGKHKLLVRLSTPTDSNDSNFKIPVVAGTPGDGLHTPLVKRQTAQPPRTVWQFLIKLNISIPYGLASHSLILSLKKQKL